MSDRETCQHGCTLIPIEDGLIVVHTRMHWPDEVVPDCPGSGLPSRQETERRLKADRKARRVAKAAALVADLQPEAAATLDAWLLHREGADAAALFDDATKAVIDARRLDDMRRAALYEYNRRNRTRHRQPTHMGWCQFCRGRTGMDYAAHLTQCALEYLAGLRDPAPPGTKVLPEEHRQESET